MGENVTLEDVAKRAKVSRATVSRAVNKPDSVSADALKRINKAIADMRYILIAMRELLREYAQNP